MAANLHLFCLFREHVARLETHPLWCQLKILTSLKMAAQVLDINHCHENSGYIVRLYKKCDAP